MMTNKEYLETLDKYECLMICFRVYNRFEREFMRWDTGSNVSNRLINVYGNFPPFGRFQEWLKQEYSNEEQM